MKALLGILLTVLLIGMYVGALIVTVNLFISAWKFGFEDGSVRPLVFYGVCWMWLLGASIATNKQLRK
jgi:Na+(H+)/acetate symporter ActP